MITRSKLAEQLKLIEQLGGGGGGGDHRIRSHHKCSPLLTFFSPKPHLSSWADVAVAVFWALVFSMLVMTSYMTLYFRQFGFSFPIICLGIFVPIHLRRSREALARKRERRLPLSM